MKHTIIGLLLLCLLNNIYADGAAYAAWHSLSADSKYYQVNHFHDCSSLLIAYWDETDTETPLNPFLNRNYWYSYIEFINKKSGKTRFKIAAPILTNLFIDEEQEVIIGMSKVKLENPYSLTLWDFDGNPMFVMNLRDSILNCPKRESVTNYFDWYSEENLSTSTELIVDNGKVIGLKTLSIDNKLCEIFFPEQKESNLLKMKVDYPLIDDDYTEEELLILLDEIEFKKELKKYLYPCILITLIIGFFILKKKKD